MADLTPPTTPIWLADEDNDGIPDVVDFHPDEAEPMREVDPDHDNDRVEQTVGTDAQGDYVNRLHSDSEYRTDTAYVSEHDSYDLLEEAGSDDGHELLEREVVTLNDDGTKVIETKAYESVAEDGVQTERTEHHRMELDADGIGVDSVDIETVRTEGGLRTVTEEHRHDPVATVGGDAPVAEEGADGGAGLLEAIGDWFGDAADDLSAVAATIGSGVDDALPTEEPEPEPDVEY